MFEYIIIILTHFVCYFVLQTTHMNKRKSSSLYYLTMYMTAYSLITTLCLVLRFKWFYDFNYFHVFIVTFITHWIIDYFAGKLSKYEASQKNNGFFEMIGFTHWIHVAALILTYQYIIT